MSDGTRIATGLERKCGRVSCKPWRCGKRKGPHWPDAQLRARNMSAGTRIATGLESAGASAAARGAAEKEGAHLPGVQLRETHKT